MSKEAAKKLIKEIQTSEELKAKIAGITDKDELVKKAVEAGYDVTIEDLAAAEKEMKAKTAAKNDELSADELESAAGGLWFSDETARDGHEFYCSISYHDMNYQVENKDYCKDSYICSAGRVYKCDYQMYGYSSP